MDYPTLTFNASAKTLYVGGNTGKTAKLSVSSTPSITKTVTYTSSNPNVASVTNAGQLTAKKAGTTTVTATVTAGDKTKKLTKTFTVKKAYIKFTSKKASLKVKKTAKFKVKVYGVKLSGDCCRRYEKRVDNKDYGFCEIRITIEVIRITD